MSARTHRRAWLGSDRHRAFMDATVFEIDRRELTASPPGKPWLAGRAPKATPFDFQNCYRIGGCHEMLLNEPPFISIEGKPAAAFILINRPDFIGLSEALGRDGICAAIFKGGEREFQGLAWEIAKERAGHEHFVVLCFEDANAAAAFYVRNVEGQRAATFVMRQGESSYLIPPRELPL